MSQSRLLIADDHPMVREALRMLMIAKWNAIAVDEGSCIGDIESLVRRRGHYRLVVLDLMLPDAHGFSGLILVKKMLPQTPVVMISSRHDDQTVASAHILGAAGFVGKSMPLAEMGEVFERAMAGEASFAPAPKGAAVFNLADASRRLADLSAAQLRVLLALADGKLNKQIANDMNVTEATVKAHLTAVFRKLAVQNRTQAILVARPLLDSGPLARRSYRH